MGEHAAKPIERPQPSSLLRNVLQRLEGDAAFGAELIPRARQGERGGTCRPAFVERDQLGVGIAQELKCEYREQDRLTRSGRTYDDGVPDVACVERQPKRCRALG